MPEIRIDVLAETHGSAARLREVDHGLNNLERSGDSLRGGLNSLWKTFAIGNLVAQGTTKLLNAFRNEVSACFKAATEAEKIDRALEAALSITGKAASGAAQHFKSYARELQRKTIYDDEAIKSADALMISMGLSTGVMDQATRGAIGLASVFTMDLEAAARAVAQGFQGNYRAIGMLIPQVRLATTEGEKHAAMIRELGKYYSRAEADVNTFAGRIEQIKGVYENLRATVGDVVIKNQTVLKSLEGIKSIMEWLELQAAKSGKSGKKAIWEYFPPILAFTEVTKGLGKAAREDLDNYAKSWAGMAAAVLDARKAAIDPLPIKLRDINAEFAKFTVQFLAFRGQAKMPLPHETVSPVETQLPRPKNWYEEWYQRQVDFGKEAVKEFRGDLRKMEDYSDQFYDHTTQGFTNAFMQFRLTAIGFKNFFIATWQAIKQAFFQILADMLARWLTMAFVKTILNVLTLSTGGSFFKTGPQPGISGMQHGFEGTVVGPRLFYVEPGVREHVSATPLDGSSRRSGGGTTNVNIYVNTLDADRFDSVVRQRVVPILKEVYAHGDL